MSHKPPTLRNLEGQKFKHLKREIKWTRKKVVLFSAFVAIPYIGLIIFASSISKFLAGFLIGFVLIAFALTYLMHMLTKDI